MLRTTGLDPGIVGQKSAGPGQAIGKKEQYAFLLISVYLNLQWILGWESSEEPSLTLLNKQIKILNFSKMLSETHMQDLF